MPESLLSQKPAKAGDGVKTPADTGAGNSYGVVMSEICEFQRGNALFSVRHVPGACPRGGRPSRLALIKPIRHRPRDRKSLKVR